MSFAHMPLYTGDYLRDTRHLTPQKHGVYLLLLMHCWDQKGPVPIDEQEAAGIANCRSADEIESLRYILTRFFVRMDDGWYNKRVMSEIERCAAISSSRAGAAKERWSARQVVKLIDAAKKDANAMQLHSNSNASGPSPALSPSPALEKKNLSSKPTAANAIAFSADGWENITDAQIAIWQAAFPAVAIRVELAKAFAWAFANPKNRKSNWSRFLTNWLSKAQDAAPRATATTSAKSGSLAL